MNQNQSPKLFADLLDFARQRQALGALSNEPSSLEKSLVIQLDIHISPYQPNSGRPIKMSRVSFVDLAGADFLNGNSGTGGNSGGDAGADGAGGGGISDAAWGIIEKVTGSTTGSSS